ncbi:hypothetical protein Tsubulata_013917 [Turnera subulata]|uniref:Uncharacterized protein n=1 Tax=Turnera subulata TaxID=218843 RepID=A0A9Q0GEZ1_9ROSI|nr:hypothetical protein Tsubulata_013917 [Turnera subulata]
MGVKETEGDVLKLVHPGRYVEIHKQPIRAAEILKRNPRHSVTRPDVFEYPWIVVNPEAVLKPGNVFFIVPNRTIYGLLKSHQEPSQLFPERQSQSWKVHQKQTSSRKPVTKNTSKQVHNNSWLKRSLPIPSCIGVVSPEKGTRRRLKYHSHVEPWPQLEDKDSNQDQLEETSREGSRIMTKSSANKFESRKSLHIPSCIGTTRQEQESDKRPTKQSVYESSRKLISKHENHHVEHRKKQEEDLTSKINRKDYLSTDTSSATGFSEDKDGDKGLKCSKEVRELKSCLRKPDSDRKLLPLKVSFGLAEAVAEPRRTYKESPTKFAGYSSSFSDSFVQSANLIPA